MTFKEECEEVGLFYFIEVTTTLAPALIIGAAIYLVGIGFSYLEIGTVFLVNRLMVGVSEIPTGIVADRYGRKFSTLTGLFIWGLAYAILPLSSSFLYVLIIFACIGFGLTFISGALSAWFIDTLKEKDLEDWIHRCTSRKASISGLSRFFSLLLVIFLYYRSFEGEVLSSAVVNLMKYLYMIAGSILLFTLAVVWIKGKEPEQHKDSNRGIVTHFKKTLRKSLKTITESKIIFVLAVEALVFMFAFSVFQGGKQPFLTELMDQPVYILSVLAAFTYLIGFFVNMKSEAFTEWVGNYPLTLTLLTAPVGLFIVLFSLSGKFIFSFVFFISVTVFMVFRRPIKSVYFQENISSEVRATMGSFFSLINQIGGALGVFIIFGYIGDLFGLRTALTVGGIIVIGVSFIYLTLLGRGEQNDL